MHSSLILKEHKMQIILCQHLRHLTGLLYSTLHGFEISDYCVTMFQLSQQSCILAFVLNQMQAQ